MYKTLLGLALLLTACASQKPIIWYSDNATAEQFEQDKRYCFAEGAKYPPATYGIGVDRNVMVTCMEARGYRQMSQ